MHKPPTTEPVPFSKGFDYSPLPTAVANHVRSAAERIRRTVKHTVENVIAVGNDLPGVKRALSHGRFGAWLRAGFGWTNRTARNFVAVAEYFGPKTEMISELRIDPTAGRATPHVCRRR